MATLTSSIGSVARRSAPAAVVMLMLVNAVNYADRSVLGVLQEQIRRDLGLSDFQLGLLIGPAFALFYAVTGLPVARLAERVNRAKIIIATLTLWSLFTAACGFANGFLQLWLWRMGVGATEAGAPPASHALIADYYPPGKRGRAMAAMAIGFPIGIFYGNLTGGAIASAFGWHWAFVAAGIPGLILAVLCCFFLFEPRDQATTRHNSDPPQAGDVWTLLKSPAIGMLILVALMSGFVGNALPNYVVPFFIREHGLTVAQSGAVAAAGLGVAGLLGTLTSGFLADRFDDGSGRSYYLVPAIACFFAGGLSIVAFWLPNTAAAISVYLLSSFFGVMIMSPTFAALQNVTDPRNRATAAAIFLFCITVAGAAGPASVGFLSDTFGAADLGVTRTAYTAACPGGRAVTVAVTQAGCHHAAATGLRLALMLPCAVYMTLLPVYLVGARVARRQLTARQSPGDLVA